MGTEIEIEVDLETGSMVHGTLTGRGEPDQHPIAAITDLQTSLDSKQDVLISGTNIKTINEKSVLGSGNLEIDSLPSQTGHINQFLITNGTEASWSNLTQANASTVGGIKAEERTTAETDEIKIDSTTGKLYVKPGGVWGVITGTLSDQTDLQTALDAKQEVLISGTNIKTIDNKSILGSGNLDLGKEIDCGSASAVYAVDQLIDCGGA